jgi:hypothetical protein
LFLQAIGFRIQFQIEEYKKNPEWQTDEELTATFVAKEMVKRGIPEREAEAAAEKVRQTYVREQELCGQLQKVRLEKEALEKEEQGITQQLEQINALAWEFLETVLDEDDKLIAKTPNVEEILREADEESITHFREREKSARGELKRRLMGSLQQHADKLGLQNEYVQALRKHLERFPQW